MRRKKLKSRSIFRTTGLAVIGVGLIVTGLTWYAVKDMPNPRSLTTGEYPESSRIFDRNGKLLYEFYGDKRRVPVKLSEIPDNFKKATLAIEDKDFYTHGGFDFRGILRGLYRTIFEKRLQGGSTLTQQLVKNALLTQERTITRKIKEAMLTVATELIYKKDQILEMYFNQIPYGGTMWGVEAAARGIFNKQISDLDLAESALIAGLPGSPTRYSPFAHPDAAKKRQEMVLNRMLELKMITNEQKEEAVAEKLNYYVNQNDVLAPHFVFYVKENLVEKFGLKKVNEGGLRITTTLDSDLQEFTQATVASEVAKLAKSNVTNGAAMVIEPKTGQILAMVGSKDYFANDIEGKFNVTTALRQPGSSIKPLNYAVGIETGKITAASVTYDGPTCFRSENQRDYCPTNYGNKYFGLQNVRTSLGNSINTSAVKILKLNGVEAFVASASAMGITTFKDASNYGLSLTLGGGEVMMTDMAVAFGVLANQGLKQELTPIIKIEDSKGNILEEYKYVPGERELSKETAFIISHILSDDGARRMVFGAGSLLNIKKHPEVSVKTGTTNDLRDNWTIGYTPDYVTLVWVGNNDNSRMRGVVSGISGAAPIWSKVMTQLLTDKPVKAVVRPQNVVGTNVCNLTGQLPPEEGCDLHYEYFKKEFVPTSKVSIKMNVLINKDNNQIVNVGDTATNTEWQDHNVIKDISGQMVCLDCPPIADGETPVYRIN